MAIINGKDLKPARKGYVANFYDINGKRIWKQFKVKKDAEYFEAIHIQRKRECLGIDDKITFKEFSEKFFARIQYTIKKTTFEGYKQLINNHLLPAFGEVKLIQINGDLIADLLAEKRSKLDRRTVRNIHAILRRMLFKAVQWNHITRNPAEKMGKDMNLLDTPKKLGEDVKAFTLDELILFLDTAKEKEPAHYALFLFLSQTGARVSEGIALKLKDFDIKRRKVRIERAFSHGRLDTPKYGSRTVDMTKRFATFLEAEFCATGVLWAFSHFNEEHFKYDECLLAFRRVLKAAKLDEGFGHHTLRHTFASLLVQDGVPLTYIKEQLGHESIETTYNYYGRWLPPEVNYSERLDHLSSKRVAKSEVA